MDEVRLAAAPIIADAEDQSLFMDSRMARYAPEAVQNHNKTLLLNDRRNVT